MRHSDHQQSQPPDPPPTPRPDPTPRGTSRKNRHPEINRAPHRDRARNGIQALNASPIGGLRFNAPAYFSQSGKPVSEIPKSLEIGVSDASA